MTSTAVFLFGMLPLLVDYGVFLLIAILVTIWLLNPFFSPISSIIYPLHSTLHHSHSLV